MSHSVEQPWFKIGHVLDDLARVLRRNKDDFAGRVVLQSRAGRYAEPVVASLQQLKHVD